MRELARNIIIFGRLVRACGLPAQPDRIIIFTEALKTIGFYSRADVRAAARCIFVRNADELPLFEAAFDAFWSTVAPRRHADPTDAKQPDAPAAERQHGNATAMLQRSLAAASSAALPATQSTDSTNVPANLMQGDRSLTYSFTEALQRRDFSRATGDETQAAREAMRRPDLDLGVRRSRRNAPGKGGGQFDARRTLRASLRQYGEVFSLATRIPRTKQRDIVLLCDISGSMDRYSRLLLQFVHGMRQRIGKVEAFVFGTRLTRITRQIRHRDINEALDEVAASVADWGGGTRIGECLREFNRHWARRVLARGAIVIIISDGWDRGDVGLLSAEMRTLQRRSYRLIWLNPLLGSKNYRPQTVGMKAALPYIDDFLPANNLKSLTQLVQALRLVDRRRPARAQHTAVA